MKSVVFRRLNGGKPGKIGFKFGLTTDCFLVTFGSVTGLDLGVVVILFFFSLTLVFEGTRLLLMPSRPRFMMLEGVMGEMVCSASAKSSFLGSVLETS